MGWHKKSQGVIPGFFTHVWTAKHSRPVGQEAGSFYIPKLAVRVVPARNVRARSHSGPSYPKYFHVEGCPWLCEGFPVTTHPMSSVSAKGKVGVPVKVPFQLAISNLVCRGRLCACSCDRVVQRSCAWSRTSSLQSYRRYGYGHQMGGFRHHEQRSLRDQPHLGDTASQAHGSFGQCGSYRALVCGIRARTHQRAGVAQGRGQMPCCW